MSMPEPLYYEDLEPGSTYVAPDRIIAEQDLQLFAEISGDDHPIHTSEDYARSTPFGRRIAHGPFGIALAIGQFGRIPDFRETVIAMTDVRDWRFKAPMFIGDVITVEVTITSKALRRTGVGSIERHFRLLKGDGTLAQEGFSGMLIACRSHTST
jgi:acyl dehydratase